MAVTTGDDSRTASPESTLITITGAGTIPIIISALLFTVTCFVSIGTKLDWPIAVALLIALVLAGVILVRFNQTTKIELSAAQISYRSWIQQTTIPLNKLHSISQRTLSYEQYRRQLIVFWTEDGRELGVVDEYPFRAADCLALLRAIEHRYPAIHVDRELLANLRMR